MQWISFKNKFELIGYAEDSIRANIRNVVWLFAIHLTKAIAPTTACGHSSHFLQKLKQYFSPVFVGTGIKSSSGIN